MRLGGIQKGPGGSQKALEDPRRELEKALPGFPLTLSAYIVILCTVLAPIRTLDLFKGARPGAGARHGPALPRSGA